MNLTFLLCIVITQLLIWILDGTFLKTVINLLNIRKTYPGMDRHNLEKELVKNLESSLNMNMFQRSTRP